MRSRLSRLLRLPPSARVGLFGTERAALAVAPTKAEATEFAAEEMLGHDPPLAGRDEAVFLLHTAAEVEHSLLVQYLYAAYSLDPAGAPDEARRKLVREWQRTIVGIATEEMGHLASVQNLLCLIGGVLNLEREDFPFRNELYPFRFKLEPLTKDSLAKYVFAEMPNDPSIPGYEEIRRRANRANMKDPVNHVGVLYRTIANLFDRKTPDGASFVIADGDLQHDSVRHQLGSAWAGGSFVLRQVRTREAAIQLIEDIALQGEGIASASDMENSHYVRFRAIYDAFPEDEACWEPARAVPTNPNTSPSPDNDEALENDLIGGRITNRRARLWAQLLNTRYRMLLADILHALHLDALDTQGAQRIEQLRVWAFEEMVSPANLKVITNFLMSMPLREGEASPPYAGPPFELPYTLNLPDEDANCWRSHRNNNRRVAGTDPTDYRGRRVGRRAATFSRRTGEARRDRSGDSQESGHRPRWTGRYAYGPL